MAAASKTAKKAPAKKAAAKKAAPKKAVAKKAPAKKAAVKKAAPKKAAAKKVVKKAAPAKKAAPKKVAKKAAAPKKAAAKKVAKKAAPKKAAAKKVVKKAAPKKAAAKKVVKKAAALRRLLLRRLLSRRLLLRRLHLRRLLQSVQHARLLLRSSHFPQTRKGLCLRAQALSIFSPVTLTPGLISPERFVPSTIARPEYVGKAAPQHHTGGDVQTAETIEKMRIAGRIAAGAMHEVGKHIVPGVTTDDLDRIGHEYLLDHGAYPSTLGYRGFPKSLCTSLNEVICHGIPDSTVIQDGDICNIDITAYIHGVHGDTNATFLVGEVMLSGPRSRPMVRPLHGLWVPLDHVERVAVVEFQGDPGEGSVVLLSAGGMQPQRIFLKRENQTVADLLLQFEKAAAWLRHAEEIKRNIDVQVEGE